MKLLLIANCSCTEHNIDKAKCIQEFLTIKPPKDGSYAADIFYLKEWEEIHNDYLENERPDIIFIFKPKSEEPPYVYLTGLNNIDDLTMANKFNVNPSQLDNDHPYYEMIKGIDNTIRLQRIEKLMMLELDEEGK